MSRGRIRILRFASVAIPIAAALALGLAPAAVRAALWLTYDPPSGPPGTTVSVRTIGTGAFGLSNVGDSFPLYLVVDDAGDELLRLGTLTVDSKHDGTGSFVVPDVSPGEHGVMVGCEPCAEFSNGRTLLPMGVFTVLAGVPSSSTSDRAPAPAMPASAVGLAVVMAAIAALLLLWPRFGREQ
jgi:hypothetical protein